MQMYAIFSIKGTKRHTKISTNYPPCSRFGTACTHEPPELAQSVPHTAAAYLPAPQAYPAEPPAWIAARQHYPLFQNKKGEPSALLFQTCGRILLRRKRFTLHAACIADRESAPYTACIIRKIPHATACIRRLNLHLNFFPPAHHCGGSQSLRLTAVTSHKLFIKQTK